MRAQVAKDPQHCIVVFLHVGAVASDALRGRGLAQHAEQEGAEAPPLIRVEDRHRDLRDVRLRGQSNAARDPHGGLARKRRIQRDPGQVIDLIDRSEMPQLLGRELRHGGVEAMIARLRGKLMYPHLEPRRVGGLDRAHQHPPAVAEPELPGRRAHGERRSSQSVYS